MADVGYAGVVELVEGLSSGRYTSEDLVQHYLQRIARLDGLYRAFVEVYETNAIEAARAADERRAQGRQKHTLDGIPFAVKDNIEVAGSRTSAGVAAWKDRVSHVTAPAVKRLQAAGGILLGKTHLTELAYSGWGMNATMPTPVNPWSGDGLARVAGGSSSGSAVAVAAGMAPLALGTDTGGSIRHPAAFCGLTGLRPSSGRIDNEGLIPLAPDFDAVGVLAHSAADLIMADSLLALALHAGDGGTSMPAGLQGLRIGILRPEDYPCAVDVDVLQAQDAVVAQLRSLGLRVCQAGLPVPYSEMAPIQAALTVGQAYRCHREEADRQENVFSPELRAWLNAGKRVDEDAQTAARQSREAHQVRFAEFWQACDALLCPTVPLTAPLRVDTDNTNTDLFTFTRPAAYLDACAVSFPAGFCRQGMPIGMQLVAKAGADSTLLALVQAYQQVTDWHITHPSV